MSGLTEFLAYLDARRAEVTSIEEKLCELQEKYETYFSEIGCVREHELAQLTRAVVARRAGLPPELGKLVDAAEKSAQSDFSSKLDALIELRKTAAAKAEAIRLESVKGEKEVKSKNTKLNDNEEGLKKKNAGLLKAISSHNQTIRELGSGFGFFSKFFQMRRLHREAAELSELQQAVAHQIEMLRQKWAVEETTFGKFEAEQKEKWIAAKAEADALQTKVEYLGNSKERIILRSVMEAVVAAQKKNPTAPSEGDPPCPRCESPNAASNRFCHICAIRLADDSLDLEGSVVEVAEVNYHFGRFSEGMQACQQIIGLLRGIGSGLDAFRKSVADVQATQARHSLAKLKISVPAASVEYGKSFERFHQSIDWDFSQHPKVFADRMERVASETFTAENIQNYFETMGQELSQQADSQW